MGFATTTFVLSMYNVSARGVSTPNVVLGLAIGYGGLVQLLAGMWEFAVGNTFGATAFSSYGGFWISFGFLYSECFFRCSSRYLSLFFFFLSTLLLLRFALLTPIV
jgi:succinate-acetate transporter protein